MKKFFIIFLALMFSLIGCQNNSNNNLSKNTNNNIINNSVNEYSANSISYIEPTEEIISSFSTNILDKSNSRQTNVKLACAELDGTIVTSGETFSFCDTLGPATPEAGYQKADTFDQDGDVFKEYGGGKCQVSSTLYNAVLKVPYLTVVERHPHSGDVDYVEEGKDAAVAYGSVDFKFKNESNYDIRINAETDSKKVTVTLIRIIE